MGQEKQIADFVKFGKNIFDVGIFSIILTAPIGSILTNMFGEMWLQKQGKRSFSSKSILYWKLLRYYAIDYMVRKRVYLKLQLPLAEFEDPSIFQEKFEKF